MGNSSSKQTYFDGILNKVLDAVDFSGDGKHFKIDGLVAGMAFIVQILNMKQNFLKRYVEQSSTIECPHQPPPKKSGNDLWLYVAQQNASFSRYCALATNNRFKL
jgi:hypothetical protein